MPLSETGKKLAGLLLNKRFAELSDSLVEKRAQAARDEARNANAAALPARLTALAAQALNETKKVYLETYLEVFQKDGAELTEEDARGIERAFSEHAQAIVRGSVAEIHRQMAAKGTNIPIASEGALSSALSAAAGEVTRELEIFRLSEQLRAAPHPAPPRRAWLQELPDEIDVLLPIASHKAFKENLATALSETTVSEPLSLVRTDVDHFKAVNDKHGHRAGDTTLIVVAQLHQAVVRGKGKAYRVGGEEMALLLPNTTESEAAATAERLRAAVEKTAIPELERAVTLSAGVVCTDSPLTTPEELDNFADKAQYRAKEAGRNRVVASTSPTVASDVTAVTPSQPAMTTDVPHFSVEESALLAAAADDGELFLHEDDSTGRCVRAGGKFFYDPKDPGHAARYLDAFESLSGRGYVRHEGGQVFKLTGPGFDVATSFETKSTSNPR